MSESGQGKPLILAAGLQSGGTTTVSWCFLQRSEMDGVLDLPFDLLQPMPRIGTPYGWCKMTIASFRWHDVADYYRWQGWEVHPLLIVRDVRDVLASMKRKIYGINGTTPEDPPLRLRLMRFLRDWEEFNRRGWPILRFESFTERPEEQLKKCCERLELPWQDSMLTWPKRIQDIADPSRGNSKFLSTFERGNLASALLKHDDKPLDLSAEELRWLEEEFRDYNVETTYPLHREIAPSSDMETSEPSFEGTGRSRLFVEIGKLNKEIDRENQRIRASRVYTLALLVARILGVFPFPRKMSREYRLWVKQCGEARKDAD
ncbi:MAG: hypothetical protein O7C75_11135 [Verrucomicrobia bacterium]|nr:hypothetical protein [Verrucomicrobiota bacterium]